jgi:hypothetical protein
MNPIPYNGDGGYLSKDDIIKSMAAEIEMLRKELNISNEMKFTYMDDCVKALADYDRLKAENDRLRKAGDALALELEPSLKWNPDSDDIRYQVRLWNAAKEGKPSV